MRLFSIFARPLLGCALAGALNLPLATFAHVTLQDGAAGAGANYRAALHVGHGCEGAATTGVQVILPAGFNGAQPMPKAGWTITTRTGKLEQPYEMHGKRYTEGMLEISWLANTPQDALPDAFYDEFVLRGTTPHKSGPIWFKVVQSCGTAKNSWVEVPAAGTSTRGLKFPAALLEVLDTGIHAHNH